MPEPTDRRFVARSPQSGPRRLWKALTSRPDGGQVVVAVLIAALGFGAVLQVRADESDQLTQARRSELVQILSDLNQRNSRLEDEVAELQGARRELQSGAQSEEAALEQTATRARQLAILAGTAPASGPGVEVTIEDPNERVQARHVMGAVQELRVAGAEAIQIEGGNGNVVRIGVDSYFLDPDGVLTVDEVPITRPYVLTVIGDPAALNAGVLFLGGNKEILEESVVEEHEELLVDAVREPVELDYAQPAVDD
ncbi:MAG TPA: DUF881 domain-containing protein [Jiangellaceae bacterium]|nr:DUF881 domain-containing protein [Jiangellaceae bacterium]